MECLRVAAGSHYVRRAAYDDAITGGEKEDSSSPFIKDAEEPSGQMLGF